MISNPGTLTWWLQKAGESGHYLDKTPPTRENVMTLHSSSQEPELGSEIF